MDENNSPEPSPGPATDRVMVDSGSKTFEMLKGDLIDGVSVENSYSDTHSDILLSEASKIFQVGMEKDLIIWEKSKIIQDAMETIETMKKNIYHIQTEYEKLDQNYNKEISNSAEAIKRMDVTREMIESAVRYSHILATSIKQLEDDKFKIVEFYNELQIRLEEEEEKQKNIEIILKEQEHLISNRISQLAAQKEKTEENLKILTDNLLEIESKLKFEIGTKVELEVKLEKYKNEMNEMKANLVVEQTNRMKYQVIQSHLKKKILQQKAEDEKQLNTQKILHKKKIKALKSKMKDLRERLDTSEESISNYLIMINDLDRKVVDLSENLQEASSTHWKEVNELEEKLKFCQDEKENLSVFIRTIEQERNEKIMKIKALTEENMILLDAQETIKLNLQEKQKQADMLLQENSNLERQLQELSLESNSKIQRINALEVEIRSHNTEELKEKIRTYEEKLEKYDVIEKELRNEISLLKETISKECCENEKVIHRNHARIQQLENEVLELQTQKEAAEKKLNDNYSEYAQVKDQLTLKTADLEKITQEFQSKMKMVSNKAEISEEYKANLEREKLLNKELLHKMQKLEKEKAILDRDLTKALERENFLNKNLEKGKEDTEDMKRKLDQDIEQRDELLKHQADKLNRAKLEMEKLSEKLESSEITIMNLQKSLESSEANLEAYKIVIQKLEGESEKRKSAENETIKRLQSEISQLKQVTQKSENFSMLLDTPKRQNRQRVNKDESENIGSASKKTPKSTRRLLSTPNRFLGSPCPSPNFKSISPIMKTRDPYQYDSDDSVERVNLGKASDDLQVAPKKSIFTSKRKK